MEVEDILSALTRAFQACDEQPLFSLIGIALAARFTGRTFCPTDYRQNYAQMIAVCMTLPYFVHLHGIIDFDDVGHIFELSFRALLVYAILFGVMLHVVPFVIWLHRRVGGHWRVSSDRWQKRQVKAQERREQRQRDRFERLNPAPPPLPRSDSLQQQINAAQDDYSIEARLIENAHILDAMEKEVAMMQAKQRFMQRLKRIFQ